MLLHILITTGYINFEFITLQGIKVKLAGTNNHLHGCSSIQNCKARFDVNVYDSTNYQAPLLLIVNISMKNFVKSYSTRIHQDSNLEHVLMNPSLNLSDGYVAVNVWHKLSWNLLLVSKHFTPNSFECVLGLQDYTT